ALHLGPGRLLVSAEQLGHATEIEGAGLVKADRHRLGRVVHAEAGHRWGDDPLGEHRRRAFLLGLVVEHLECGDEGPVGVVSKSTHAGPKTAEYLLPGLRVGAAGSSASETVHGAVDAAIRVV